MAEPRFKTLRGEILLDGKKQPVSLTYNETGFGGAETVQVGDRTFKILSRNGAADDFSGRLREVVNGDVKTDLSISVYLNECPQLKEIRAQLKEFSENLANKAEVKCEDGDNAFLLIGDDLKEPYPLKGNCLVLR